MFLYTLHPLLYMCGEFMLLSHDSLQVFLYACDWGFLSDDGVQVRGINKVTWDTPIACRPYDPHSLSGLRNVTHRRFRCTPHYIPRRMISERVNAWPTSSPLLYDGPREPFRIYINFLQHSALGRTLEIFRDRTHVCYERGISTCPHELSIFLTGLNR